MRYRYCPGCNSTVESIKYLKGSRVLSECPKCTNSIDVGPAPSKIHFVGASVQNAEYNPAFGCVVKNKQHRNELAKQKGMEEIGNEPVEKIHTHYDAERKETNDKIWRDA